MKDEKRICIICETPYQVFSAIYLRNILPADDIVDIYIGEVFYNSASIANNITKSKLFNRTIVYNVKKANFTNRINEFFSPKKYLDFLIGKKDLNLTYNTIFMSYTTHFAMAMVAYNRSADVVYYDDGLGSYIDHIGIQSISSKRKICYMLGGTNVKRFDFVNAYLFDPRYLMNGNNINVEKIDIPDNNSINTIIDSVFNYSDDNYCENRIVYFALPSHEYGGKISEAEAIKILEKYNEECIVRLHPREVNPQAFRFDTIDKGQNQWELIAKNEVSDEHILIGVFSTAQVIPKLIYDKEPYLIFEYKMYKGIFSDKHIQKMEMFIRILKKNYRNPSKIIELENYSDLEKIISNCLKGQ